jgi:ubiquitin C-terminal hydrolase
MQLNQTIVDELFVGQFTSTIKCKHCAELSQSYDPFLDISLPIE